MVLSIISYPTIVSELPVLENLEEIAVL